MALLKRQTPYEYIDDQDPLVLGRYVGNWTHHIDHNNTYFNDYTYTDTPTSGSSLSLNFSGTLVIFA